MPCPCDGSGRLSVARLDLGERGLNRHEVVGEAEVFFRQAQCEPHELGQVEDRHVEALAQLTLGALLVDVEAHVAEGARRDHAVGALALGLRGVAAAHRERHRFLLQDEREPAALDPAAVVDPLAAERGDDLLQRGRIVGVVEPQILRRPQDVAAIERRDAQPRERALDRLAQFLQPHVLDDDPQEVLDVGRPPIRDAVGGEQPGHADGRLVEFRARALRGAAGEQRVLHLDVSRNVKRRRISRMPLIGRWKNGGTLPLTNILSPSGRIFSRRKRFGQTIASGIRASFSRPSRRTMSMNAVTWVAPGWSVNPARIASRRSRMIASIGCTSLGQTSTQKLHRTQSQMPSSRVSRANRSRPSPSRGSATNRYALASAAGPRNPGETSRLLHADTHAPHRMQASTLWNDWWTFCGITTSPISPLGVSHGVIAFTLPQNGSISTTR